MDERPVHTGDPTLEYSRQWELVGQMMRTRGMNLPNNYLVVDIETTGLSATRDTILQIGILQCLDGEVKRNFGVFIQTPEDTLQQYENSDYVRGKIAEGNEGFIKAADVRQFGVPRSQLVPMFRDLVDRMLDIPDSVIVGHNLVKFDIPFIEYFTKSIGIPVVFPRERVFDTGAMYKANKLGMLPAEGQNMWEFFLRVANTRARGVKWNLGTACQELGLEEKHNLSLDAAHDASADVLFTHYVYQAIRDRSLRGAA